jgi:hypothetical protein
MHCEQLQAVNRFYFRAEGLPPRDFDDRPPRFVNSLFSYIQYFFGNLTFFVTGSIRWNWGEQ